MHRTDRLYDLIQILRDGRLHRAADMAERLGVSVRTIWRDMAVLMASGMPVEGERGVGYILRAPLTLPPMILTGDEIAALRQGVRLVAEGGDPVLARAARSLAAKIASVTPAPPVPDPLFDEASADPRPAAPVLPQLRAAIRDRAVLIVTHITAHGHEASETIQPRGLEIGEYGAWLLGRQEETGHDIRLPVGRILALTVTGRHFATDRGYLSPPGADNLGSDFD